MLDEARAAGDREAVATALRAQGLARRERGDLTAARRFLEEAVTTGATRASALARGSLASVLAASGELDAALAHLAAAADALASPADRAPVEMQRGDVLLRLGRTPDAVAAFDAALAVAVEAGDVRTEALTRINRAILHGYAGRFDAADEDLRLAEEGLRSRDLHLLAADCRHNRGFVAGRRGDVVAALTWFDDARRAHERLGVERPTAWMDECEVLLRVGLAPEARALAEAAEAALVRDGQHADAAEAQLLVARACELDGDPAGAGAAAERAVRGFSTQRRDGWRLLAELLRQRTGAASGAPPAASAAIALADDLEVAGWREAAVEALLLAGQLATADGQPEVASVVLARASAAGRTARSPAERESGWLAEARRRRSVGDRRGALAAARRGLALTADAALLLGARDLRTGVLGRGRELAALGVAMAVEAGRPATVLRWEEARRWSSVPRRPVRPPADDELQADLAALREAGRQAEDAALAGDRAADAVSSRDALEQRVLRRARLLRRTEAPAEIGAGAVVPAIRAGEVRERLGAGQRFVELLEVDGRLFAVDVGTRRMRLVALGSMAEVAAAVEALRFALGRALTPGGRPGSVDAARATATAAAADLAAAVVEPLRLGDDALVLAPTGVLHGVPWPALPGLRGRAMTAAPSAAAWLRASERAGDGPQVPVDVAVVVGGPEIPDVGSEVAAVAASYSRSRTLAGRDATVAAVTGALAGAPVAHVAAHGRLRADNPLFSSLLLSDGPLTVHDLDASGAGPRLVFLSACDVGRPERRADDAAGVVSAFLDLGTATLVASVLPVPHDLAARVATAFHAALAAGERPAAALVAATEDEEWSPFVAFGAG